MFAIPNLIIICSFKLETEASLLLNMTRLSLDTYGSQMAIGNLLHTRKTEVRVARYEHIYFDTL
jgi:hypothetical protein